jgi:hypothetical protein
LGYTAIPALLPSNNAWTGTNTFTNDVSFNNTKTQINSTGVIGLSGGFVNISGGTVNIAGPTTFSNTTTHAGVSVFNNNTTFTNTTTQINSTGVIGLSGGVVNISGGTVNIAGTINNTNGRLISNAAIIPGKTDFCSVILGPSPLTNSDVGTYIAFDNKSQTGGKTYAVGSTGSLDGPGTGCFEIFDVSSNLSRMVIDGNGNVGIGNLAPGAKLEVLGNGRDSSILVKGVQPGIMLNNTSTNGKKFNIWSTSSGDFVGVGKLAIFDELSAAYRMLINETGNVGIGTTSPAYKLDVSGGIRTNTLPLMIGTATDTNNARMINALDSTTANGTSRWICWGKEASSNNSAELKYFHSSNNSTGNYASLGFFGNEVLYVNASGKVGIGKSSPVTYKLGVEGGIECVNLTRVYEPGAATNDNYLDVGTEVGNNEHFVYGYGLKKLTLGTNGQARMVIASNGKVGIGTTSPSYALHVASYTDGSYPIFRAFSLNGAGASNEPANTFSTGDGISIYASQRIFAREFDAYSDSRIKTNIVDIDDEKALSILRKIQPKTYDYVDKLQRGNANVIGFIAQEIKKIIPKAVTISKDYIPNFMTLCQMSITDASNILLVSSPIDLSWNPLHDQSGNAFLDASGNESSDASGNKVFNVKFYDQSNNEIICKTTDVLDKRSFLVESSSLTSGDYFLYGQEVDDFHNLNKDSIFTVVTAAVQDIDRIVQNQQVSITDISNIIQQQNVIQQSDSQKIQLLEGQVATLNAQLSDLQNKYSILENNVAILLSNMQQQQQPQT